MTHHILEIRRHSVKNAILNIWLLNYLAVSHWRAITYLFVIMRTSSLFSKKLFELLISRCLVTTLLTLLAHMLLRYPFVYCQPRQLLQRWQVSQTISIACASANTSQPILKISLRCITKDLRIHFLCASNVSSDISSKSKLISWALIFELLLVRWWGESARNLSNIGRDYRRHYFFILFLYLDLSGLVMRSLKVLARDHCHKLL